MSIRNKVQQNYVTSCRTMSVCLKNHPNNRLLDPYYSDSLLICNVKMLLMSLLMITITMEITQMWKFQTLKSLILLPLWLPICPVNNLVDNPGQRKELVITLILPCDCKSLFRSSLHRIGGGEVGQSVCIVIHCNLDYLDWTTLPHSDSQNYNQLSV